MHLRLAFRCQGECNVSLIWAYDAPMGHCKQCHGTSTNESTINHDQIRFNSDQFVCHGCLISSLKTNYNQIRFNSNQFVLQIKTAEPQNRGDAPQRTLYVMVFLYAMYLGPSCATHIPMQWAGKPMRAYPTLPPIMDAGDQGLLDRACCWASHPRLCLAFFFLPRRGF